MTAVPAEKDYRSIGSLCGILQRSPSDIEQAAQSLAISPALRLNGVAHFDGNQVAMICAHFRQTEDK